jgi:hypothetical protein
MKYQRRIQPQLISLHMKVVEANSIALQSQGHLSLSSSFEIIINVESEYVSKGSD